MATKEKDLPAVKVELETVEVSAEVAVVSSPTSAMALITSAVEKGLDADSISKLYDLHERSCARYEQQRFTEAIGAFQEECPPVPKRGKAEISSAGFSYRYAQLDDIERIVRPVLHKHRLSYTFDSETIDGFLHCTCILRHAEGHTETARFAVPPDKRDNRSISEAQKSGAALTYARRQSLTMALGLRIDDPDTDAAPGELISEHQALDLESIIEELKVDKAKFMKFMNIAALRDMSLSSHPVAINFLNAKRRAAK